MLPLFLPRRKSRGAGEQGDRICMIPEADPEYVYHGIPCMMEYIHALYGDMRYIPALYGRLGTA